MSGGTQASDCKLTGLVLEPEGQALNRVIAPLQQGCPSIFNA